MKGRTAAQWVEAGLWLEKARGVPAVVAKVVKEKAAKALKSATPAKPKVRIPRGTKTPQNEKKELHGECEALCKALVFHRDCGDWRSREGNCITCEQWRTLQWGHFIKRQRAPALLYSVQATGGQCAGCNGPGDGEALKYAEAIDRRDGPGSAAKLMTFFYRLPWTWKKSTLIAEHAKLSTACRAKGIDVAVVLAEWKGPKSSPGASSRPEPASGEGPNPPPHPKPR